MINIVFVEGNEELLEAVKPLWEELNQHHYAKSSHFKKRYENMSFDLRKKKLLGKIENGQMKIIMAKDDEEFIGYCISTVAVQVGEIESIYIKPAYRGSKIGDNFMKKSLEWIESFKPGSIQIGVAAGNESAFGFYSKYGFFPRLTTLERVK
jgi:Acetyltransferases